MKKCQYCAEEIQDEAIVCRYCGRTIKPSSVDNSQDHGKTLLIIGGLGIILGSALPWGEVTSGFLSKTMYGTTGDGILTMMLGVIILLSAFGKSGKLLTVLISLGCSLLVSSIWIPVFLGVASLAIEDQGISMGSGLFILGASIFLSLLGSMMKMKSTESFSAKPSQPAQPLTFAEPRKVQEKSKPINTKLNSFKHYEILSVISGIALIVGPILMVLFESSDLSGFIGLVTFAGFAGLVVSNWPGKALQY